MRTASPVQTQAIATLDGAEQIALRQNMSTVVKMLMARAGLGARQLLALLPILSVQPFYDRLNAKKDWEAGELRAMAEFFGVHVSTFFMDPDEVFGQRDQDMSTRACNGDDDSGATILTFPLQTAA